MVILLDDRTVVGNKNFFATNDSTNGGPRWKLYISNRTSNHFRCTFITVSDGFNRFRSAAAK